MELKTPPRHPNSVKDYVNAINEQQKKPIKEQLNDLKVAVAELLVAVDKIIDNV